MDCCSGFKCGRIQRLRDSKSNLGKKGVCIKVVIPPIKPPTCVKKAKKCIPLKKGLISLLECCPGLECKKQSSKWWSIKYACAESKPTTKPTKKPTSLPTCRKSCSSSKKCCSGQKCSGKWWGVCIATCAAKKNPCNSSRKCCTGLKCSGKWWGKCEETKPTPPPTNKPTRKPTTSKPTSTPTCAAELKLCSSSKKCCAGLKCSTKWWGLCQATCAAKDKFCNSSKKCCTGLKCSGTWWGKCEE